MQRFIYLSDTTLRSVVTGTADTELGGTGPVYTSVPRTVMADALAAWKTSEKAASAAVGSSGASSLTLAVGSATARMAQQRPAPFNASSSTSITASTTDDNRAADAPALSTTQSMEPSSYVEITSLDAYRLYIEAEVEAYNCSCCNGENDTGSSSSHLVSSVGGSSTARGGNTTTTAAAAAGDTSTARPPLPSIVFVRDSLLHVARLVRVLSAHKGHALLVGSEGSGRQSLARVAALLWRSSSASAASGGVSTSAMGVVPAAPAATASRMRIVTIDMTTNRKYGLDDFCTDIRETVIGVGVRCQPTMLLLSDRQLLSAEFWDVLHSIISSGDAPVSDLVH